MRPSLFVTSEGIIIVKIVKETTKTNMLSFHTDDKMYSKCEIWGGTKDMQQPSLFVTSEGIIIVKIVNIVKETTQVLSQDKHIVL